MSASREMSNRGQTSSAELASREVEILDASMMPPKIPAIIACLCIVSLAAAKSSSPAPQSDKLDFANGPVIASPVYPFEALLHRKHGKVKVDCLVDESGKLVNAAIVASDAPEFSGAVLAYVDVFDFSMVRKVAGKNAKGMVSSQQAIEFDVDNCGGVISSQTCPSPAAKAILEELRHDPTGKSFATLKTIDRQVEILTQTAPKFPRQLPDTVRQGSAVVEFYIAENGNAELPRAVSASDPAFGYAACQSVNGWKFKPAMRGGKPTVVKVRVPINFELNAKS